jgi:hypothetical protein
MLLDSPYIALKKEIVAKETAAVIISKQDISHILQW